MRIVDQEGLALSSLSMRLLTDMPLCRTPTLCRDLRPWMQTSSAFSRIGVVLALYIAFPQSLTVAGLCTQSATASLLIPLVGNVGRVRLRGGLPS